MAIGLVCLGCPVIAENAVIARFETAIEVLPLTAEDIAEATPMFGEQGAGLAIALAEDAGAAFADLTGRAIGETLTFLVCDEVLVSAVIRDRIPGRVQAGLESLGEANFYARVLSGEITC